MNEAILFVQMLVLKGSKRVMEVKICQILVFKGQFLVIDV